MKLKQLQALQSQYRTHLKIGMREQPDLKKHVKLAIVSGELPKLRPVAELTKLAREEIVNERYADSLAFSKIFVSCNGYEGEMKEWKRYEAERQKFVRSYRKVADPLIRRAELNDRADAEEISEALEQAVVDSGLAGLKALSAVEED